MSKKTTKKAVQETAEPLTGGKDRICVRSVGWRVKAALHDILLITIAAKDDDGDRFAPERVIEAIATAAERAHEEIYWLTLLPSSVLHLPAPGLEDENDIEAGAIPYTFEQRQEQIGGGR